ncbi:GNAT family N-acetyltransferase [Streptomyces sp. G44]|uniref:GNAT family N-acetyltransferase n=1 Tax=Streptomyces sp. G44 TaxID=2807632 RepID=UPI0019610B62|nr:GNAT family N-acetyltransferase [Streptomyces sp. G44]MBM7173622.1 GNAT family N-acetyltransferase [Streptomyces sp. G44]
MTTTLRPAGPLQRGADGAKARTYDVCVNSRPVGSITLATDAVFGAGVCRVTDLRIAEPDRGRGRATVAALAAEEVARGWGCERVEADIPAEAAGALRLATALGYVERNRRMAKPVPAGPAALPPGVAGRPMTEGEYEVWLARAKRSYTRNWSDRGVPEAQAHAKAETDYAGLLPQGQATPGALLSVLTKDGAKAGTLWLQLRDDDAFVFRVEVDEDCRGRGHGRSLMLLAEAQARAGGRDRIGLNVFAGNATALCLYESLGYEPFSYSLYKPLL